MAVSATPPKIFISYRREDAGWPARWLADQLASQFGAGVVFQDVDSIRPGDDFAAEIEVAVAGCIALLALIGPRWLTAEGKAGRRLDDADDWVRRELEAAITRGVRIIPVLIDGAKMPAADELPPSLQDLSRKLAVTLSPASLDTRKLVSVLETVLASAGKLSADFWTRMPETARPVMSQINRLLMDAVHAAFAFRGKEGARAEEKASVLARVISAAAVAAPERVAWLAAEAESIARLVDFEPGRSYAVAWVAAAMAAADPEHAEAMARSVEDGQQWALAEVAVAIAAVDPEHAEAMARSLDDVFFRLDALTGIARLLAGTDPERAAWLAAEAEVVARSIKWNNANYKPLADIASLVAAFNSDWAKRLATEAVTAARSIEDRIVSSHALADLVRLVAATDPEWARQLAAEAVTVARSVEDRIRLSRALADIAQAVTAVDPEWAKRLAAEAVAAARSVTALRPDDWTSIFRSIELADIAGPVAVADVELAEALARSIEKELYQSRALAHIAEALAASDPERAEAVARSIEKGFDQSRALAHIATTLAVADPERAEAIALSIEDEGSRATALAEIVLSLARQQHSKAASP